MAMHNKPVNEDLLNKLLAVTEERHNGHIPQPERKSVAPDPVDPDPNKSVDPDGGEPKSLDEMNKTELLEVARLLDIEGRSNMNVDELRTAIQAVREA